ncbi:MAG: hypothetical protein OEV06_04895 [Anaerolineae bacterium]|jgi:hypothetical protein|nr:hypothetical protein [Anaerolineae bacterium]
MSIGEWISAFFTVSGPGGIVVLFVIGLAALVYFWLTRWIITGGEEQKSDYDRIR